MAGELLKTERNMEKENRRTVRERERGRERQIERDDGFITEALTGT